MGVSFQEPKYPVHPHAPRLPRRGSLQRSPPPCLPRRCLGSNEQTVLKQDRIADSNVEKNRLFIGFFRFFVDSFTFEACIYRQHYMRAFFTSASLANSPIRRHPEACRMRR